ncbi:GNAT family N-acetyltransferase [Heyndrickxia sporothermodurans]
MKTKKKRYKYLKDGLGTNTFFLGVCQVYGYTPRAIYKDEQLIGFASHGYNEENKRHELISIMIGHQYQGVGYGVPALKLVVEEMVNEYRCEEIYLSVIYNNERAKQIYEKVGFKPTGEVEQGHHPEPIYCLKISS